MKIGIFTHYFPHRTTEAVDRIHRLGFDCVQLNTGFPDWELTAQTSDADCRRLAALFTERGIGISAIAGYRNLVAPDAERRQVNLDHIRLLLDRANDLGSPFVTTEAGSRHPHDDWAPCAENGTAQSMQLLIDTLGELTHYADRAGATLVVEPSVGTILDSPRKIEEVAAAIPTARLGFVADWANLLDGDNIDQSLDVLGAMTEPLKDRIKLAHIKDANRLAEPAREQHHHVGDPALYGGVEYPAPGLGVLDLTRYCSWLEAMDYDGAVILEHLAEKDVPAALACVREAIATATSSRS